MVTEKRKIQLKEAREKFKERNPNYDDNYYEKKLKENPDYNKQRHNKRKDKMKKYKKENKEKVKAQRIIEQRVKKGLVENPKKLKCKDCSNIATEYHHPDYSKPLLVIPLCHSCHIKRHRETQNQEIPERAIKGMLSAMEDVKKGDYITLEKGTPQNQEKGCGEPYNFEYITKKYDRASICSKEHLCPTCQEKEK